MEEAMTSPVGRLAARVSPTTRRRIMLATIIALAIEYELDAVADDDSVRADSISETNRWLYGHIANVIGPTAASVAWNAAVGAVATWYAGHVLKPTLPDPTN
jgi:hypothetical protein